MALRFVDGFDHYVTADILKKWSANGLSGSYGGGTAAISTSSPRTGTSFLSVVQNASIRKVLDNQATWVMGFGYFNTGAGMPAATHILAAWEDSGTLQLELRITTSGQIQVTRNGTQIGITAGAVITIGAWAYIEWKFTIHDSTGSFEVRVNGVNVLSATGQDTKNTSNSFANAFVLNAPNSSNTGWKCDDLYVCDGSGSANNDFLGDIKVQTLYPSGAGNYAQWTPSAGSNFQNVDDAAPNSDTDYNSSSTAAQKDSFALGDLAGTGVVKGAQLTLTHRKDDAGTRTLRPLIRQGGSDAFGTTVGVSDSYTMTSQTYYSDPTDSAAWTVAKINSLEAGYELVS